MVKVLMVGPARSVKGGISAVVNNYYTAGIEEKIELKYIETMEDGSKFHKLKVAVRAFRQYKKVLKDYSVVHIHMASDKSLCRKLPFIKLAKKRGKKLIIHQHGGNFEDFFYRFCNRSMREYIGRILSTADVMLVVAPHLKILFGEIIGESKIVLFPNTLNAPEQIEHDYSSAKLLFLGRLCKEKGIEELIMAARELKEEFPKLEVYLGGKWEDLSLKKQADEYKDWILQLGWIGEKEKQKYLRECNIFVLPTYFEGLPVSLLEGMAYGCACIASRVGGIPQILENGRNGILISPKNVKELKEAIKTLLDNPVLQQNLGREAHLEIKNNYDLSSSMKKLLVIYGNLYNESKK